VRELRIAVSSLMALLVIVLSTGCGSSSSTVAETNQPAEPATSEQGSGAVSKAKFLAQAEEICEDAANKKSDAVAAAMQELGTGKPSSPDLAKMVETVVIPIYAETIEQIDHLEAPEADRAQIENIVQEYEVALGVAEKSPDKAVHQYLFGDAVKAAEAYGFEGCSF
jgi:hypothetical protein